MKKLERNSKTEYIELGKMCVSELAQRQEKTYRVDKLVNDFDPDRLGHPVVNLRDNRYWIMDGQHRIAALKRWNGPGWENIHIECQVFTGLSEAQEAELFLRLNNVLGVRLIDKFKKAVVAQRTLECGIEATLASEKLTVSESGSPGSIKAVAALLKVTQRADLKTLAKTLRIARDSYGDPGLEGMVIDGLGHLCQRYDGVLNEAKAKQRLSSARGGVKGLINRAEAIHLRTGNPRAICVAAAAVDIINSGKGGKKLPGWWKTS